MVDFQLQPSDFLTILTWLALTRGLHYFSSLKVWLNCSFVTSKNLTHANDRIMLQPIISVVSDKNALKIGIGIIYLNKFVGQPH